MSPAPTRVPAIVEAVREFVLSQPVAKEFLHYLHEFLAFALPAYVSEGKTRLTIAIGCTGGRHRSVYLAERLARAFSGRYQVHTRHREIG